MLWTIQGKYNMNKLNSRRVMEDMWPIVQDQRTRIWTSCSSFRSKRVKHRCNYGVLGVQNIFDKSKIFWLWPNLIGTYTCKDRWKLVAANCWATTVEHRCNYGVLRVQSIFDKSKIFWFWPNLIWTYTCKDRWKLVAANRWATTVKHRCNYGVLQNILDLI